MQNIENKFLEATKNILEKNLKILEKPFCEKKVILVYDTDSKLASLLSEGYIKNLNKYKNIDLEIIDFDKIDKNILKDKLLKLQEFSTVILVQSTNFRIEDFRIRISLHKNGVGCLEHNHLGYIKDDEIENYADVIEYQTPYFEELSNKLKNISDNSKILKIISKDGNELIFEGGFEDMKQNTGNYEGKNRGGSFPIGENFTEIVDFKKANGKIAIRAYPDTKMIVHFLKDPFILEIKESLVINWSENTPKEFVEILEKIKKNEDGEIYLRELGFGLNPGISWKKTLNDVNAFERIAGFHMSLGKNHGIYRKKFSRKITQRYHIDIFSDTDYIMYDNIKIFENEKFVI